ncbi:MAG: hypothetical protein HY959_10775 [Ignavibacteriae bacterium]|nr:hypothetical protein [Ignavibacteriota bacterium]
MKQKYLFIYFFVFLTSCLAFSQGTGEYDFKTNLEIFSKLTEKSIEKIENKIIVLGREKVFCLIIEGNEENKDFLYTKFRQKLYNFKIISEPDSASADYIVYLSRTVLNTGYIKIFGSVLKSRKVEREISVLYSCEIKQRNSQDVLYSEMISEKKTDNFLLDNKDAVERGDYSFLKGRLPEMSFFEKAVIPGAVILASAVTIILFFAIRSK